MTERTQGQAGDAVWLFQIEALEKRCAEGNLYAVLQGVSLCRRFDKPLPDWLADAVLSSFKKIIDGDIRGTRGPNNKLLGHDESRARDIIRRNAVFGIRAWQASCHFYYLMPDKAIELWYAGGLEEFGNTFEDACEIAQICLAGTKARGSPNQMKGAFRDKSLKDEHILDWDSVVPLGFVDEPGRVLYKSTLKMPGHIKKQLSRTEKPSFLDLPNIF